MSACCDRKISGEFMTKGRRFSGPLFAAFCLRETEAERTAHRVYNTPGARQSRGAQPDQAACPRSRAASTGTAESTVVDCHQSPPQSLGGATGGDPARSGAALSPLQWIIMRALRVYKVWVSPWLPSACRFHPTCSEYMRQAIERHGAARGVWMGFRRLARCHPFHEGGFDPVR